VQKLSDLSIRTLPPGTYWDVHTPGLGLRVGKHARSFIVLVRSGKRKTIGRYPYLTLAAARRECARIKAEALLGKIHPTRTAFADALADYFKSCEQRVRPRTLKNYREYLNAFFPYGRRSVADISTREIIHSLDPLTPSQREHAQRIGRTFFRWCVRQRLIDRSPMENMAPAGTSKPRARVLTDEELRAVYRLAHARSDHFPCIVSVLILTGQRRGEIAALQWDWIKGDTITFPAAITKNGREHTFPIGPATQAVLASIPRIDGSPYVFPALRQKSPATTTFNGWSKSKARFDRECGTTGWTLHDLRRTFATNMQRLGVRLEVTEALLNHVSGTRGGIVGIYQRYHWLPEMREAVLRYEAWLATLT
jgi:integrase